MIQKARVRRLNQGPVAAGRYVLYWMQQSQRGSGNAALEVALQMANRRALPVVVGFGLTDDYPDANLRHYAFMLEGLREVEQTLAARGIGFVIRRGAPPAVALELAADAALVVCDRGYLRHQRAWGETVAAACACAVVQVEADAVVPVDVASTKHEFAARTLRPKLHRVWDEFLEGLPDAEVDHPAVNLQLVSDVDLADLDVTLASFNLDRSVTRVTRLQGGTGEARRRLATFIDQKLAGYGTDRNEPAAFQCSFLSPYLHFGQIAPVEVALAVRAAKADADADRASFLEELIVRRELAINFVHHQADYDAYACLPNWAQVTLAEHRHDPREPIYTRAQLEAAATHDRYWNAAMREMVHTGFMHNYMRMYWAKKILEWSRSPEEAFATTLALNNKYFLDGRDPNSYANVAWTYGLHDRPWGERPVFGKVRYMNARGLERKFDMKSYILAVDRLVEAEG